MTSGIGPGVRRFRELLARGEEPDAGAIAREHPGEALAIADELRRTEALYWARAHEEMWLARAEVMRDAGEDITFGTVLRYAREDSGLTVPALVAAARERGADLARMTIERLEANQIAVTEVEPAVWAALIDDLEIERHEFVAGVWMAHLEMQGERAVTSTGRRVSALEPDAADYLDRVRVALGIPTESTHGDAAAPSGPTTADIPTVLPARDLEDAIDVRAHIDRIFAAPSDGRAAAIRQLFVETLDFNQDRDRVDLSDAPATVELPDSAERIAVLEGVHVVYVALEAPVVGRVRTADVTEAARQISHRLGDDLLLVVANAAGDQLHLVLPDFTGTRPVLRRLVFERGQHNRTPVEQVSKLYRSPRDTRSVRVALTEAFDVEPVTKRFFQEYKRVFEQVEQSVTGFAEGEHDELRLFVQTLFNRLMFVYFLQRKGWLDFRGDRDYLKALWSDYRQSRRETDNFHLSRLRTLFFAGLNNPASRDLTDGTNPLIGDVPFLNGGLFEQGELDKRDGVAVPDQAIEAVLTELFDSFNFTVMESTPFDIEVAVDPEMLGKVFEELVTGRHESGSYYTPRPVVSFMCREALKGYLEAQDTGLAPEAIADFVDAQNTGGIEVAAARRVAEALSRVTVVDPAAGSGAYLLGMMQELVELQTALYNAGVDAKSLYELKLEIIQRNLYGVDIDEFAVNIAMLRMWLSLAIEFDGEKPEPLPNLDFKVVCGDSLLGPDPGAKNYGDLSHDLARRLDLGGLKAEYMRAFTAPEKDRWREAVRNAQEQVRTALGDAAAPKHVVDWRVEFAEVFDHGGFDIAIANPPYVRMEQIGPGKQALTRAYPEVHASRADYFVYFYNRAVQSLRGKGVIAFITSNKYMRAGYGKKVRKYLSDSLAMSQVVDFGDLPVFTATAYPAVLIGRKAAADQDHQLRVADLGVPVRRAVAAQGLSVTTETVNRAMDALPGLLDAHGIAGYPQALLREDGWILEDPALIRLFERLMNQGTPLGEFVGGRIYRGIVTGLNEAFVIDQAKRDALVEADSRSAEIIKPWLRGRDIGRWRANSANLYVIFTSRGVDIRQYSAIEEHLRRFRSGLEKRATAHLHPWYEQQQPQEGIYPEFDHPKIVWPDIAREMRFAYDTAGNYPGNTAYAMPTDESWLLSVLNSELTEFLLCQITNSLRGGFLRAFEQYVSRLPIVTPDPAVRRRLETIAELGVGGKSVDADELNDMVCDLYSLSRDDVALIRDWFEVRGGP